LSRCARCAAPAASSGGGGGGSGGGGSDGGAYVGAPIDVPARFVPGLADAMVCDAPPLVARAPAAVEVSLDGQYFTHDRVVYMPLDTLSVLAVSPASGPVDGGTAVRLSARGLRGATKLRCRFGNATVVASWDDETFGDSAAAEAAGGLRCVAPAWDGLDELDAALLSSLRSSLNTSQAAVDAHGQPAAAAPAWPGLPTTAAVEVSANGEDFSRGGPRGVRFTYVQPLPTAAVTSTRLRLPGWLARQRCSFSRRRRCTQSSGRRAPVGLGWGQG